ncbi:Glycosyl hydrolases family 17 [Musa troglodytarum]|uniref:Glycosyl hydrolases family 17 n=1 Tax=Musa troglodytarum TaxID=320322 RepID=A0A9E7H4F7_9LILI|nr:Glycosyl hydrolases family 17 [Musa troglodytarum]
MATRGALSIDGFALVVSVLVTVPTDTNLPDNSTSGKQSIGVCYGMLGDNLPQPSEVVSLCRSNNIGRMRLYSPNQAALQALRNSNIQVLMDVPNEDLQSLASDPSTASDWVQSNVVANWPSVTFRYIAVGNEVIPGDLARYVLPAMRNIQSALSSAGLQAQIKVSTAVSTGVLGSSYPPSAGAFSSAAKTYLSPILQFLASNAAPLFLNAYPYFTYADNPSEVSLSYALFTAPGVALQDGQFGYRNLFDAIVDAVHAAIEVEGSDVEIVVSESGWPSAGGTAASVSNAKTYNQNLIRHVGGGTPRRSGRAIETYIHEMFDENQKASGIEQKFGMFHPNKQPVYPISFS